MDANIVHKQKEAHGLLDKIAIQRT